MKKLILLIFIALLSSYNIAQDWTLQLSSNVELRTWKLTTKADKEEKPLGGASIILYKDAAVVSRSASDGNGDFTVMVPPNGEFILEVSYAGCNTKKFLITTQGVPDAVGKDNYKPTFSIGGFVMAKPFPGIDYSGLKKSLVKVEYKARGKNFDHDDAVTDEGLNIVTKIANAENILIDKFCSTNKAGDVALAKPDCPLAKSLYEQAIATIPGEQYPVIQLAKVGLCLKEKEEAAKKAAEEAAARTAADKAAAEKVIADKAIAEKAAAEKANAEKTAKEKEAKEKVEEEKLAKEKAAIEKQSADKAAEEKAAADKLTKASEKEAKDKAAAEKAEAEKIAKEKADVEKITANKAADEKNVADKIAKAAEKEAKEKAAAEKAEAEKIAKQKATEEKVAKEKPVTVIEKPVKEKVEPDKKTNDRSVKEKEKAERARKEKEGMERAWEEDIAEGKEIEAKRAAKRAEKEKEDADREAKEKENKKLAYEQKYKDGNGEMDKGNSKNKIPQVIGGAEKYKVTIAKADDYFKTKRYSEAKTVYEEAMKYKANDVYAANRIEECNKLLAPK